MADLSVKLGNLVLKNPVMTASGTFGYGMEYHNFFDISRLGAVVVKGIRMEVSDGNPTPRSEKIINATPMGRFGDPEELIGTLVYLCDDKASGFVNGTVIPVDGGFSAYSGV